MAHQRYAEEVDEAAAALEAGREVTARDEILMLQ